MISFFLKQASYCFLLLLALFASSSELHAQDPDTFQVVALCNLDLNRTATKLTAGQLNNVAPAVTGYKWNNDDNETVRWRPQGIAHYNATCKEFSVVSWYGRNYNYSFPCNSQNADYRNRGSRVSFVDITDMDSIRYRHVLLVDENYNTFYDMHAGGLIILNDTLYAPDSRGGTDAMYAFPLNDIKEVPANHLNDYYNYRYLLKMAPSATDSLPINPSFVSYDWDEQKMLVGRFSNCGPINCSNPANNQLIWYNRDQVDRTSPFYNNLLGKMQGVGAANNLNQSNKKDVWVSTSFGYDNNSSLYAFSYDFGINTLQNQSVDLDNNYARFVLPPGIEDIHVSPNSDTIWTLTEFSPRHPTCSPQSSNQRYVFGFERSSIRPPGACDGDITLTQATLNDTAVCTPGSLTFLPTTNYVSYAKFDASDNTWINLDSIADTLSASNRSVFMWLKKSAAVSNESQMLLGMNTSTGGNICNLQIGTNERVGIFDGNTSHYSTTTITDGQWHHVGYTYNEATNETKIYIDGVVEQTFTTAQTSSATTRYSIGQEFDSGLSTGNFLEGTLTEVSIWNDVLVPNDVALLMQRSVQINHPKRSNLMGYYPMNNTCGDNLTVVKDISGNGNNGKAYGTIRERGVDVQTVDDLEQIPSFNSVDYFSIDWSANGSSISTADSLVLPANSYAAGTYQLSLSRNPFVINDVWNIDIRYTTTSDVQTACGSYTWIDGNTYSSSNNSATATLTNAAGCDSIVTLNLTINTPSSTTDVQTACGSYTWIDGNTYSSSNNSATATLTNAAGCDSIVTLNLTVTNVDTNISTMGNSLVATATNASYQWFTCVGGSLTPIAGATAASFSPTMNGDYAVAVTQNNCTLSSSCVNFMFTNNALIPTKEWVSRVYPNPTTDQLNVSFDRVQAQVRLRLLSTTGQVVFEQTYQQARALQFLMPSVKGLYLLEIATPFEKFTTKVVKK
jgi:hypothetical protein